MSKLRLAIVIIIIVALILFFYPKESGNSGTATGILKPDGTLDLNNSPKYKDCQCFGIKVYSMLAGGGPTTCYGLVGECSCYTVAIEQKEGAKPQRFNISCT